MKRLTTAWIVLSLALAFGAGACKKKGKKDTKDQTPAEMKPDPEKLDKSACPSRYRDLMKRDGLKPGQEVECTCAKDASTSPIWGNMIFTTDSAICGAAVFAGALAPGAGGKVKMMTTKGCKMYKGGKKHGIAASAWASFPTSFYFPGFGSGKCAKKKSDVTQLGKCPDSFSGIKDVKVGGKYECMCWPEEIKKKASVWGDKIYTSDSSICRAAKHAGVVDKEGKRVTVAAVAGCEKYKGKKRHGVKSSGWGSFKLSFFFPGHGSGACE